MQSTVRTLTDPSHVLLFPCYSCNVWGQATLSNCHLHGCALRASMRLILLPAQACMYAVNAVQHTYILHICKQLLVAQLLIYVPTWLCFYAIVPGYSSSDDQLCDGSSGTAGHLCPWGCQHSRHRCCTAPGIHCCDMSILPYSLQTLCVCLCVLSLY
jgi:hypothetical protein